MDNPKLSVGTETHVEDSGSISASIFPYFLGLLLAWGLAEFGALLGIGSSPLIYNLKIGNPFVLVTFGGTFLIHLASRRDRTAEIGTAISIGVAIALGLRLWCGTLFLLASFGGLRLRPYMAGTGLLPAFGHPRREAATPC